MRSASLFLVGLDQEPVRIAGAYLTPEGPEVAGLYRVAHRAGDDFAFLVARHRSNVGFEADGYDGKIVVAGRSCDQRLLDLN